MIKPGACPRCKGAVIDYSQPWEDGPMCVMCGWRQQDVPPAVQDEVEAHLGKSFIEHNYTHKKATRGKPPLSGWEREKRRRDRQRGRGDRELNAS